MLAHLGELVIIQARPAQPLVVDIESQGVNQMQGAAGIGAQAYDIAGVGRNLRLIQDHIEQTMELPES